MLGLFLTTTFHSHFSSFKTSE